MPLIRITTSNMADEATRSDLLKRVARIVAEATGKPEELCMVVLTDGCSMHFVDNGPSAFIEIKSIGALSADATAAIAEGLRAPIQQDLGVPPRRTYIEFAEATKRLWAHNGKMLE